MQLDWRKFTSKEGPLGGLLNFIETDKAERSPNDGCLKQIRIGCWFFIAPLLVGMLTMLEECSGQQQANAAPVQINHSSKLN
jgi:hypothetical protein